MSEEELKIVIKQPGKLLDDKFQMKLIKILIEDEKFSKEMIDMLKVEYFDGVLPVTIMSIMLRYFEKYLTVPSYDTFEDLISIDEKDDVTKEHLSEFLKLVKEYKLTDKKHVISYTKDFCKKQSFKIALEKAAQAWEKAEYDTISQIILDGMKFSDNREVGHSYVNDIEKRLTKKVRNPIPCLPGLDEEIGGGLASGELGVVLAPTGAGKSMMLVKFATTAMEHGKKVIYYSMELSETMIGNRFDSCFTGIKINALLSFPDAIREKTRELSDGGGDIIIKEFPTGTSTVNSLRSHMKQLERDGFIPDVIFVDYADIMKPTSSFTERRFSLTNIYEGLRALAMELEIPIWTASQAGRAAINESKFDLKVISESLGKAQTADVVVGIGRTDDDKIKNKATLLCMKNRNGRDGFSLDMNFDTSKIDIEVTSANSMIGIDEGMRDTAPNPLETSLRDKRKNPENFQDFNNDFIDDEHYDDIEEL